MPRYSDIEPYDKKNGYVVLSDAVVSTRDIPTADVREVVHAHYTKDGLCSRCESAIPTDHRYDYIERREIRYCYYCGARMDEE